MGSANNEIQELINMFYYYIEQYENRSSEGCSIQTIKNSFEAANLIEKTVVELSSKSLWPQFLSCLNSWLHSKKRTVVYDEKFYRIACDHLLLKHLYIDKDVEIALELYTTYCPKERFQKCIEAGILKKVKTSFLLSYIENDSNINKIELECKLLLFKWTKEISRANSNTVVESVVEMLKSCYVDKKLLYLTQILVLETQIPEEIQVQSIIIKELVKQMSGRSKSGADFWYTLLEKIDKNIVAKTCMLYNEFLISIVDFLVHSSCLMKYHICNRKRIWKNSIQSICPNLTFENIVVMFQYLINYNEYLLKYIKSKMENCKTTCGTLIWNDIIKLCF